MCRPITCDYSCENHGTHLLGALPQHIFSLPPEVEGSVIAVRINLYAASQLSITVPGADGGHVNTTVSVDTAWPLAPHVGVTVHAASKLAAFDLVVRIPKWVSTPSVAITVNGTAWKVTGQPGSYVHISLSPWPAGATKVGFHVPMKLESHLYNGVDQFGGGMKRYAFTIGPILLAASGNPQWNTTLDCLRIPKVDATQPEDWLIQGGEPLHFMVKGQPAVTFKPYYAVNADDKYATYPAFDA